MVRISLTILAVLAISGCMPSQPLDPGAMDHYWQLSDNLAEGAPLRSLHLEGTTLPSRWVVRRDPAAPPLEDTLQHVQAQLDQGVDKIDVPLSIAQAEQLKAQTAALRQMLEDLGAFRRSEDAQQTAVLAETLAGTLTQGETVLRGGKAFDAQDTAGDSDPLAAMLMLYLNEQVDGQVLGDLSEGQLGHLRVLTAHVAVQFGCALTHKQPPQTLAPQIAQALATHDNLDTLESELTTLITAALAKAAPAAGSELTGLVTALTDYAPHGLAFLEAFLTQWNNVDQLEAQLRDTGDEVMLVTRITTAPHRKVRMADVVILQPALEFTGVSEIVVIPHKTDTGEAVVLFEPVDDGAVTMRFEGVVYSLAKLLAFPLADADLREIRVTQAGAARTGALTNVMVLMEAAADQADPRRILAYQEYKKKQTRRHPFTVESTTLRRQRIFNYCTPKRVYSYQQVKDLAEQLP